MTLGLMTLLSREREEGEVYRQRHGVKYHASTITINSELQKWKKQKANRDQRREKLQTGKVLEPVSFGCLSVAYRNIRGQHDLLGLLSTLRICSLAVTGLPPVHLFTKNVTVVVIECGEEWSVTTEVLSEPYNRAIT